MSRLRWSERANWMLLIGAAVMCIASLSFFAIAATAPVLRVSFLLTGLLMLAGGIGMGWMGWGTDVLDEDAQHIRETGVVGSATITALQATGVIVKKDPEVALQLRLVLPGKPAYLVTKTEVIPQAVLEALAIGTTLKVFSDPSDPLSIAIDWEPFSEAKPWLGS